MVPEDKSFIQSEGVAGSSVSRFHLMSLRHRLEAFIDQINDLEKSEFPYEDSRRALRRVRGIFDEFLEKVMTLKPKTDIRVINDLSNVALQMCTQYLPVLGFILRSTNVRNGFELVGPLRRLAKQILQPKHKDGEQRIQLLLSSEWDYMPLFRSEAKLRGYIMIGLPAHESSNPLLFPLCGHELGHALWEIGNREAQYSTILSKEIRKDIKARWEEFTEAFPQFRRTGASSAKNDKVETDLLEFEGVVSFSTIRNLGVQWATQQAEETYCDTVGLRIFGGAYLLAFTHLLSPGNIGKRLPGYPNLGVRIEHMRKACSSFLIPDPGIDPTMFDKRPEWELTSDRLLMNLADEAVEKIVDELIKDVKTTADGAKIPGPDESEIKRILAKYHWAVPACESRSLPDILNAGWKVYEDEYFWKDFLNIQKRKESILRELLLKNMELFEVEQIDKERKDSDGTPDRSNR